jgi:hypothetical protein
MRAVAFERGGEGRGEPYYSIATPEATVDRPEEP